MEKTQTKGLPYAAALGALGVVFGDIGTSPLYAFRECFHPHGPHPIAATTENLVGAASLIFYSLLFIVSFKYLYLILRLDNRGEGGVLALAALVRRRIKDEKVKKRLFVLGIIGAALIYADGMLTPSISVLSAVEGLKVVTPGMSQATVVEIAIAILVSLFAIQRFGTGKVGKLFGPIVLLWFLVLAVTGVASLVQAPEVLLALSPHTALQFLLHEWRHGLPLLAAVFLAVTGGEALYADLGHFGKRPIRLGWFGLAFPALVLNYLGQASLILRKPEAVENPFFLLVPQPLVLPLTILAMFAAIIASQALIAGAFSLTSQAIQLQALPRLRMLFTSETEKGQIYLPVVNWVLAVACVALVAAMQSSAALAGAYGVAIVLTMTLTSVLFYFASQVIWRWPKWKSILFAGVFLAVDMAFLASNALKFIHGGWLPLAVAGLAIFVITTWMWGRQRAGRELAAQQMALEDLLVQVRRGDIPRTRGLAVFMTGRADVVPLSLLHNLKHNRVLHEQVILLHVITLDDSRVDGKDRLTHQDLGEGLHFVTLRFGFAEEPDVPEALTRFMPKELRYQTQRASFFLGRESIVTSRACRPWTALRLGVFAWMLRNATPASAYFRLPANRVVELGTQLTM